jgi:lysophospholipase L1-like esterase
VPAVFRRLVFTSMVAAAAVSGADAGAQVPTAPALKLNADTSERGWIGLRVDAPAGSTVSVVERTRERTVPVATLVVPEGGVDQPKALAMRCDKRRRILVAGARTPDGAQLSAERIVKTPSCAGRFAVSIRPRTAPRAGRRVSVRVRDLWGAGAQDLRICLRVTRASRCADRGSLSGAAAGTTSRLRADRPGRAEVVVEAAGARLLRRLDVREPGEALRVLVTGDSMIQIVDSYLEQRLSGRARVSSDARISTGISKPAMLDWVAHSRRQARSHHPHVTAVFLGANDGFAIGGVQCCGETWVRRYSARVRRMMASYRRQGAGRVYWLLLPTPRKQSFARVFRAVNAAVRSAASPYDASEVDVIDLVKVFTPGGRYRSSMGGRTVRQSDGVHLSTAGASIAAGQVIRRLRSDGLLG